MMKLREAALRLLSEWEAADKYINLALSESALARVSPEERAALTALVYTTVEHKLSYDYYIAALAGRSIDKLAPRTRNILRLGMCQISDMEAIPDYAAVNETVSLAKNRGERSLVNAVLRAAARAKEAGGLPLPPYEKNPARHYSVKFSMPLWIVKKFVFELGEDEAVRLLSALNERPPLDLTVNSLKTDTDALAALLAAHDVHAVRSTLSENTLCISEKLRPAELAGFAEGLFFVQDEASALAVKALSPREGEMLVDVCAAPGGKSLAAAIAMRDRGTVFSFDLHPNKLSLIQSGAKRLGLTSLNIAARDARVPDPALLGKVDKLICDVPCSGLGVIAKKPDLRYKGEEETTALPALQLEILEASAKYLKAGGELVYSTCTLNRAENGDVVDTFLARHSDFAPVDFSFGAVKSSGGRVTLYPHIHSTDGFFIAKLARRS